MKLFWSNVNKHFSAAVLRHWSKKAADMVKSVRKTRCVLQRKPI